jgi:hypothetical protein
MYAFGEIIKAYADKLKYQETGGLKYHLCVCDVDRRYMWLCSNPRKYDFQVLKRDCPKLPNEISYVSLSSILHVPDSRWRRRHPQSLGLVSGEFMVAFRNYIRYVPALSDDERRPLLDGLDRGIMKIG